MIFREKLLKEQSYSAMCKIAIVLALASSSLVSSMAWSGIGDDAAEERDIFPPRQQVYHMANAANDNQAGIYAHGLVALHNGADIEKLDAIMDLVTMLEENEGMHQWEEEGIRMAIQILGGQIQRPIAWGVM